MIDQLYLLSRILTMTQTITKTINQTECQQLLIKAVKSEPDFRDNLSKLTQIAWGTSKNECRSLMGSSSDIQLFVHELPNEVHGVAEDNSNYDYKPAQSNNLAVMWGEFWSSLMGDASTSVNQLTNEYEATTTTSADPQSSQITNIIQNVGIWIVILIVAIMIFKLARKAFETLYDIINAHRMIYLRLLLPRGDSKSDRDREKEIAKDMKEKIGRMTQVFSAMHKLGELSLWDTIMDKLFHKPRVSMMMHYEDGQVSFIIGVYPEYQDIIEGAIGAQYSESTIELMLKPNFTSREFSEVIVMEPVKDPIFPIRTFKTMADDPMNNVIDTMSKISSEDTFTLQINIKPTGEWFNNKALKRSEGLYRNDSTYTNPKSRYHNLNPFTWFKALKPKDPNDKSMTTEGGKDFVRMTKSKEEALNVMGEEAGKRAFKASLFLISSSNNKQRVEETMRNMASTMVVYKDEYNNELDHNQVIAEMFGWFYKPVWMLAVRFHLIKFFFKENVFSENALASLFHLPDGMFNRSQVIKRMDYKILAAPDNMPELNQESGYIITGSISESYKKGDLTALVADSNHRGVGSVEEEQETTVPYDAEIHKDITEDQILIADDGTQTVKQITTVTKSGLKVFKDGTLIGVNVYRNKFTPIYIKRKDRTRHQYVIGKSGSGKSVALEFMARQDAWNGDGFCMIDPHGDLVESVLNYIPPSRAKDVIYFDAGDEERPMGLNLYHITDPNQSDRVVNDATQMFLKLFGPEVFGPRLQEYFKFGSLTLLEDMEEGATILDVPRLFTDEAFREYKSSRVQNPIVRSFWEKTYANIGDREKEEIVPYLTSKFVDFSTNRLMRNIIGQTKSVINFRECMDEGKILLVNLSKGKIGDRNTNLLGMIIVSQIANGAMSRANIPEEQRRDFYLYVDEFQNFVTNTFADILSEARKYHLALIMAHQYIGQLDGGAAQNIGDMSGGKGGVKDAVFGNVGTIQSFKVGAQDAEFLEKEYAPVLSAQDIIGISNFKTYTKLNINNATSRVFSIDSIWTQDYENKKVGAILREYSAKKYGRKREFVEAEISARIGILPDDLDDAMDLTADMVVPTTDEEVASDESNVEDETMISSDDTMTMEENGESNLTNTISEEVAKDGT